MREPFEQSASAWPGVTRENGLGRSRGGRFLGRDGQHGFIVDARWCVAVVEDAPYPTDSSITGVVDYKPGAVTIAHVGVQYFRPIGEKWSVMAFAKYSRLPDEIADSPFMEPDTDGSASMFIGFSRGF